MGCFHADEKAGIAVKPESHKDPRVRVPGSDGAGGSMGCAPRFLPRAGLRAEGTRRDAQARQRHGRHLECCAELRQAQGRQAQNAGMARRPIDAPIGQAEKLKAGIQVKVGHPFRVSKRQFGRMKNPEVKKSIGRSEMFGCYINTAIKSQFKATNLT